MVRVDCVILGAGIAGLWTRAVLASRGYSVLTIEAASAGAGQTIASQGILHRGLKYQLSPAAAKAATTLAAAHRYWEAGFKGEGPVDLRQVRVLTERMHMWTVTSGLLSSITASAAAATLISGARKVPTRERSGAFAEAGSEVGVFEVQEACVEVRSLLSAILATCDAPVRQGAVQEIGETTQGCRLMTSAGEVEAEVVICCAGEGNGELARMAGHDPGTMMQLRPLNMVALHDAPMDLHGHCLQPMSDKPYLTVTTSLGRTRTWWLGGNLAEEGVARTDVEQRGATYQLLERCLPWLKLSHLPLTTHRIARAEGLTPQGRRPDGPMVIRHGRVIFGWPTKLALAPMLAEEIARSIEFVSPSGAARGEVEVGVATPPWEERS